MPTGVKQMGGEGYAGVPSANGVSYAGGGTGKACNGRASIGYQDFAQQVKG